jgi:ribulose-phosphate 3-epimerase
MNKKGIPAPCGYPVIVPSVLSADFACLQKSLRGLERAAGWVQLDVMDGHFVPNLSFGSHIAKALGTATPLALDAHLMVERPDLFLLPFAKAGVSLITVHEEAGADIGVCLRKIKSLGLKAGLALRPKTPLSKALKHIGQIDVLLIMTVEPGFGGQDFMSGLLPKIASARRAINEAGRPVWLQVDGGINKRTALAAAAAGADSLVMGSAVFSAADPAGFVKRLSAELRGGGYNGG